MRHARAPRPAARWASSLAVLSAALLVVGLSSPAVPADAAPEDPASSTQQATQEQPPAEQQGTDSQEQGGEQAAASSEGDADRRTTESEPAEAEQVDAAEAPAGEQPAEDPSVTDEAAGDDAAVSARTPDESTAEAAEQSAEEVAEADPVLSTLTVQVTDASGAAVPGVGFELWLESNDDAGLQSSADTVADAGCTTGADGACTVGEDDSGAAQLEPGTYYWVQTETPDGYQAPAEADEPVGTVTITDAEAGTDLDPTEVTLTAAEDAGDEATESAAADAGTSTSQSEEAHDDRTTGGESDRSAQAEEQEAGSADANLPRDESERPGVASAPLVAPDLLPRAAALGSVGIGDIQARLWGQTSNGDSWYDHDCLTYDPQGPGASTTWVGNPGEARAGHGDTGWTCSFDRRAQSVLGVTPSVATSVDPGQSFLLGQTTHYNNPIQALGDRFAGSLSLRMSNVPGVEFTVPWEIWETDNAPWNGRCADGGTNYSGINGNGCADRITFTSQVADQTVEIDGVTYTLVFDGFSPATGTCPATRPNDTQNVFWTMESDTTSACVYGTLVQVRNLTIVKDLTTPDAAAPSFTFTSISTLGGADWDGRSFSLDPNGTDSRSGEVTQGEGVTVTETAIPDGWSLNDVTCDGLTASDYSVSDDTLTIASVPGAAAGATDIVCTFTNTTPQAMLTVQKTWVDGFAGDVADLSIDGAVVATSSATGATGEWSDVENQGSALVTSGATVELAEQLATDNVGHYTSSLACSEDDGSSVSVDNGALTMPAAPVTCTFTNERTSATVTVQKTWVGGLAGDSADLMVNGSDPVTSTSDGSSGSWADDDHVVNVAVLSGDEVAVSELLSAQNAGTYDSSLTCDAGISPTDDGAFRMPDENVTCTFTNTRLAPGLQVVKHGWTSASHDNPIASGSPVPSGTTVYWTYEVTNTGQTVLQDITVNDDQVGPATCPADTLPAGDSMTCTASGPVTAQATAP